MSALGPGVLGPHKCSVACPEEKLRVYESTKKGIARSAIEPPQPLGLCRGQAQTGHLDVLALHTLKHVKRLLLCHIRPPLVITGTRTGRYGATDMPRPYRTTWPRPFVGNVGKSEAERAGSLRPPP
jgi:hypothetical protein